MSNKLFRQEAIDALREKFLGEATIARPLPFWVLTLLGLIAAGMMISVAVWGQYTRRERAEGFLQLDVGEVAAHAFKPCSLEMGGKNAIIVLDDANIDLAVEGALWGAFGTTGQRCTAASRMIVQKGAYNEFLSKFVDKAKSLKVGDGSDESTQMGPQINKQQLDTTTKYVDIVKQKAQN